MSSKSTGMILLALTLLLAPLSAKAAPLRADEPEESAAFLFTGPERWAEPRLEQGPWLYESPGVTINVQKDQWRGKSYYAADIRLRAGERVFGGFAQMTPPGKQVEMPVKIARRYRAVLGFTGDFLCHHANPKGVMIRDGKTYFDRGDADMLAVFDGGEMDVFPAGSVDAQTLLHQRAVDVFAFGPILLMDGQITPQTGRHHLSPGNNRTGIGLIEPGHCIAVVTTGSFTLREFAALFASYGCVWAYNLDGGHSAAMVLMGEQLNAHGYLEELQVYQRPLPDLIMVGRSEGVPGVDEPSRYRGGR